MNVGTEVASVHFHTVALRLGNSTHEVCRFMKTSYYGCRGSLDMGIVPQHGGGGFFLACEDFGRMFDN